MNASRLMAQPVAALIITAFLAWPFSAAVAEPPGPGSTLPAFRIPAPTAPEDLRYLGIKGSVFQLGDVNGRILIVEIVGAHCPQCYTQAPLFNTLYKRLERAKRDGDIKMLAIAAGATPMEADTVRHQWGNRFPVVADDTFSIHKLLGEPRTPFTLVIDRQGRVHFTHTGVIQDIDAFYQTVKQLLDQ